LKVLLCYDWRKKTAHVESSHLHSDYRDDARVFVSSDIYALFRPSLLVNVLLFLLFYIPLVVKIPELKNAGWLWIW